MIIIESEDLFLNRSINSLLQQKDLLINENKKNNEVIISLKHHETKLFATLNNKTFNFSLPMNINSFLGKIIEELFLFKILFNHIEYFPYQRAISFNQKKTYLTDIQNKIVNFLFKNENGIDKYELYRLIWNKDAEVSMNKLDTHLTNLKNQINNDLNLNFIFQSNNKILKLIIN